MILASSVLFCFRVEVKEVERFGKPVHESDENEANLPAHSNYDVRFFEILQI